ncbi:small membrane A-kinase anchor protein-like [Polypterus senegalus]
MGCVKSKQSGALQNANAAEGKKSEEEATLVNSDPLSAQAHLVHPLLLDYAQRLSEEIVSKAVQQWADFESKYGDIPYIESDVP